MSIVEIITKRCSCCGQIKSTDEFSPDIRKSDGLTTHCKTCHRVYAKSQKKTTRICRKKETIEYLPIEKLCTKCGKIKPQSEFTFNRSFSDGLSHWCRDCSNKTQKSRGRRYSLKSNYGITEAQYDLMLEKQGGVCALCGKTPEENNKVLFVDHNHKTFKIRGLLCSKCNIGIGHFNDDSKLMRKVADYLDA